MREYIYLDNAATTFPKPIATTQALTDGCTYMASPGRGAYGPSLAASRTVYHVRKLLAKLFNAEAPERIALTSGATESLNIAIQGLFTAGDHVITTQMEHNSVLRPLYLERSRRVELSVAPVDEKGVLDYPALEALVKPDTKALVVTHASNVTGNVNDLGLLSAFAKRHGLLLIVDAAQTAGILPIDVQRLAIDVLCFTGHKGLLGPQGTGGIYVREGVPIRSFKVGGSGIHSFSETHPQDMPTALEAGTMNMPGICGLEGALEYLREIKTVREIYEHDTSLAKQFLDGVRLLPNIRLYGDIDARIRVPVVSLNIGDLDSATVSDALWDRFAICTRSGAHCAPLMHKAQGTAERGAVRFSFGYANRPEDVEAALKALTILSA